MITSMHVENFKCFKDFDIKLDSFNVLIGPNDTGKTAFLELIRVLGAMRECNQPATDWHHISAGSGVPLGEESHWQGNSSNQLYVNTVGDDAVFAGGALGFVVLSAKGNLHHGLHPRGARFPTQFRQAASEYSQWLDRTLRSVAYYKLNPDALRQPSPVLESALKQDGAGLPTFLDDLQRTHRSAFARIEGELNSRFRWYREVLISKTKQTYPDVKKTKFEPRDSFALKFRTSLGVDMPCGSVSDGVMLSLAFLAVANAPEKPTILLVEEPENGVHYASLKDIVETLRQLATDKGVQVILTTHSPYLLDCVQPEEVHVFAKDEESAVRAGRLSDHPDVEKVRKHFMTGAIWTGLKDEDIVNKTGEFG